MIDVGNKTMMASHPPFDFICLVYFALLSVRYSFPRLFPFFFA